MDLQQRRRLIRVEDLLEGFRERFQSSRIEYRLQLCLMSHRVSVPSDKLAFIGRSRRIFPIDALLFLRFPVGQRIECLRDMSGLALYRKGNRRSDRLGFFTLKAAAVNRKTPVGDRDAHLVEPPVDHTERMPHL